MKKAVRDSIVARVLADIGEAVTDVALATKLIKKTIAAVAEHPDKGTGPEMFRHWQTVAVARKAIRKRRKISFQYRGELRVVEPHLVGLNDAEHPTLSAWFVDGYSESGSGPGWRDYLLAEVDEAQILEETFPGPRVGYHPDGGQKFHGIFCCL